MPWFDNTMQLAASAVCAAAPYAQLHSAAAGVNGTANLCSSPRLPVSWAPPTGTGDFTLATPTNFTGGGSNNPIFSVTFWSAGVGGICRGEFQLAPDLTFNLVGNYALSALDSDGIAA